MLLIFIGKSTENKKYKHQKIPKKIKKLLFCYILSYSLYSYIYSVIFYHIYSIIFLYFRSYFVFIYFRYIHIILLLFCIRIFSLLFCYIFLFAYLNHSKVICTFTRIIIIKIINRIINDNTFIFHN